MTYTTEDALLDLSRAADLQDTDARDRLTAYIKQQAERGRIEYRRADALSIEVMQLREEITQLRSALRLKDERIREQDEEIVRLQRQLEQERNRRPRSVHAANTIANLREEIARLKPGITSCPRCGYEGTVASVYAVRSRLEAAEDGCRAAQTYRIRGNKLDVALTKWEALKGDTLTEQREEYFAGLQGMEEQIQLLQGRIKQQDEKIARLHEQTRQALQQNAGLKMEIARLKDALKAIEPLISVGANLAETATIHSIVLHALGEDTNE